MASWMSPCLSWVITCTSTGWYGGRAKTAKVEWAFERQNVVFWVDRIWAEKHYCDSDGPQSKFNDSIKKKLATYPNLGIVCSFHSFHLETKLVPLFTLRFARRHLLFLFERKKRKFLFKSSSLFFLRCAPASAYCRMSVEIFQLQVGRVQ